MMKITGLSHLFKWENLHNWWLTKYFFAPLYMYICINLKSKKITLKTGFVVQGQKCPLSIVQRCIMYDIKFIEQW